MYGVEGVTMLVVSRSLKLTMTLMETLNMTSLDLLRVLLKEMVLIINKHFH